VKRLRINRYTEAIMVIGIMDRKLFARIENLGTICSDVKLSILNLKSGIRGNNVINAAGKKASG